VPDLDHTRYAAAAFSSPRAREMQSRYWRARCSISS
jgi:hypothetical protein